MIKLIKNLSPSCEFIVVILIAFGYFSFSSLCQFFLPPFAKAILLERSNTEFNYLLIYELLALLVIGCFLKVRDWKVKDFNLDFSFKMVGIAFALLGFIFLINGILLCIIWLFGWKGAVIKNSFMCVPEINISIIVLVPIINPFFEELFLIGYIFKRLENLQPWIIILISTVIRLTYHTYQGLKGILAITITGLVFSFYYYKYRKLAPLILAHGISNFISLYYEYLLSFKM
jgi:membrane protease YdiL (CAAX protease family)